MPWARAIEVHPRGHGYHAHLLIGRAIPKSRLERAWTYGYVDIRKIASARGGRDAARRAASYLLKGLVDGSIARVTRGHLYEVAQGFQVALLVRRGLTVALARRVAIDALGGRLPDFEWWSCDRTGWLGPPVLWLCWD